MGSEMMKIHPNDNVSVLLKNGFRDEQIDGVTLQEDIAKGHKVALCDIVMGENIVKYGFPIGHATCDIKKGSWVHSHNMKTNLEGVLSYEYHPSFAKQEIKKADTFLGYEREDGNVGIRNELWIIPTVGCVNDLAQKIAEKANAMFAGQCDGVYAFPHPYGCSQLGEDQENTQKILCGLIRHPNAAGVLVLGLGCENNSIEEMKKVLKDYKKERVKFLVAQEESDEEQAALTLLQELADYAAQFHRKPLSMSRLVVGLKCGGSDGLSGITANPLVGKFSDKLIGEGGTTILTEVPEMFGAEQLLMNRCQSSELFERTVSMINDFKEYYLRHGQPVGENPSPGNKKGGITTLEEKSLGCVQKGGSCAVSDVLSYGESAKKPGLALMTGPGNDLVASTVLTAAGAHLVLFTTGRGTPFGTAVPTVKISTNSELFQKKPHWIDWNAGLLAEGEDIESMADRFYEKIRRIAEGEKTCSEKNGYRGIAIFKDGVTL